MKYRNFLPLISVALALGCASSKKTTVSHPPGQLIIDGKIWSSAFQQRAAEYKALCLQAFTIAKLRLDEAMEKPDAGKKKAIITDIDETFLDNSPYAVQQALQGKEYETARWYEWTSKGIADTLAGAMAFFRYAASKNVEIFYITNREEVERTGTLLNLQRFNLPFADNQHLVMRQTESSKEARRRQVMATHDVLLLLGDNLADFSDLFDRKTEAQRDQHVQQLAAEFGKKFIVLPNFNYGGWEDAIYENSRNWTPAQKDSLVKSKLRGF
jgi:5'-nucleotidase (lipoprotein e(P4) family)